MRVRPKGSPMTGHDHSEPDETPDLDNDDVTEPQKIRYNPSGRPRIEETSTDNDQNPRTGV
jgi:hypothetical protein